MNFIEFLTKWILNFEPIFYTTEQVIMLIIDLIKVPTLFISAASIFKSIFDFRIFIHNLHHPTTCQKIKFLQRKFSKPETQILD